MRKNIASQIIGAQMVTAVDGTAFTGSVTCYVAVNNGTQTIGSVGSGVCTHKGNGFHVYAPSQAETNGNHLAFTFIGTGAVPVTQQVYTIGYDPHSTLTDILADTNELQSDDTPATLATINGKIDTIDTNVDAIPGLIAGLENISALDVNTQCHNAIVFNHLDHLLAAAYDPASKPGNAGSLLNTLVENDAGVPRFTSNALEQGPSSGGDSAGSIAAAVWDLATSGHTTAGTFGEQVKTTIDAILADTNEIQLDDVPGLIAGLNDPSLTDIQSVIPQLSDIMSAPLMESYAENGEIPNLTQAVLAIHQMLMAFRIVGNKTTIYKIDGSTPAFTVTMDSPTSPTSALRP